MNIITKKLQGEFEEETQGTTDRTPEICGYFGRACRQMEKDEGANRALCMYCSLAEYGKKEKAK